MKVKTRLMELHQVDLNSLLFSYNPKLPFIKLNEKSLAYLATIANVEDGPLVQLKQKGVLPDHKKVVVATLCLMMYSLASIELACNNTCLSNPNLSITALMHCVAAINTVLPGVEFKKREFLMSWLFYCKALEENNVDTSNLQSMRSELFDTDTPHEPQTREGSHSSNEPTDFTDSPPVSTCTLNIIRLPAFHMLDLIV